MPTSSQDRITLFAEVLLPIPVPGTFTYRVPYALNEAIRIGQRVVVQFGKTKILSGLVVSLTDKVPQNEVKFLIDILDEQPLVNDLQLQFWNWIKTYYLCHLGEVMQAALPSALKLSSESMVALSNDFVLDSMALNDYEYLIVEALQTQPKIAISEVSKIIGFKKVMPLIHTMMEKGILVMEEELNEKYKAKYERFVRLSNIYREETALHELMDALSKKAYKQLEVLLAYLALGGSCDNDLKLADVLKKANATSTILKALVDKGVFEVYERQVSRLKDFKAQADVNSIQLTPAQQRAYEQIKEGFDAQRPVLLHGVTSSGKTELYIKLIQETLDEGKQVLYLLPEIALTAQIINRLKRFFGDKLGVYHSRYGTNERVEVWQQVRDFAHNKGSQRQIIIGSRSAVFLPYSDIGLIIVDEEHDSSFKQMDPAPRYHARDAAIVLATLHHAKILLGSATPSYESYFNAQNGRYRLVELTERYGGVEMPEIILSDMRVERKRKTLKADFGSVLLDAVKDTLEADHQAILFQNRRGFSLRIECDDCHHVPQCINCDVSLIYHKAQNVMRCHYCGYTTSVPSECPQCHSTNIKMHGFGTEKVEEDLKTLLPEAKVARLDLDTTRSRNDYQRILEAFQDKETDILVGTQMVTKGLDFDSVKVVGILNADNMLSFPDFRAHERSFQLMSQVAGRAGRKGGQGKVIIQTYEPSHPVLQDVLRNDFLGLYQKQMITRRQFGYPPFYRIVMIRLKHKDFQKLNPAASSLASMLRPIFKQDLLGPEYPMVSRVKNLYIKQMLVKFNREHSAQQVKDIILKQVHLFQLNPDFKSVQVQLDVDPM
ncbi:MAG: primosomal protein N' [Bacteroidales bacterium]|nr:primosomal protein N' [Bacteroidales bacterium]